MTRLIPFCLGLVLSLSSAWAEKKPQLEVRFLAESIPADLGQVSLAFEDQRTSPFDLPMNNLSTPQIPPARTFQLWLPDKNRAISTITLPQEGVSFVVLLLISPKGGYSPVVMRSDNPEFKPGDIYFINNADKTVLGYVGTSKFTLAPAKSTIVRPQGARAEKFYDVGLGVREEEGDRVLTTTRWPEDKMARFYVFFYVNPATKRVAYRAVDEFVPPAPPAP
jgi:hypothetical protein